MSPPGATTVTNASSSGRSAFILVRTRYAPGGTNPPVLALAHPSFIVRLPSTGLALVLRATIHRQHAHETCPAGEAIASHGVRHLHGTGPVAERETREGPTRRAAGRPVASQPASLAVHNTATAMRHDGETTLRKRRCIIWCPCLSGRRGGQSDCVPLVGCGKVENGRTAVNGTVILHVSSPRSRRPPEPPFVQGEFGYVVPSLAECGYVLGIKVLRGSRVWVYSAALC